MLTGGAQVHSLLQQLQLDNTRLVKLLASTEEYREFAATSDASGGLTYVPPTQVGLLCPRSIRLHPMSRPPLLSSWRYFFSRPPR